MRSAAAVLAARTARELSIDEIHAQLPGGTDYDALRVQEALLTADLGLTWKGNPTRTKVVAIVASPLIVPIVATIWLVWRLERALRTLRRRTK